MTPLPPLADGLHPVPAGKLASVVTSLAMLAPTAPRPERNEPGWRLTAHARPDAGWYRALFARLGADWLWSSRLLMEEAALRAVIHDPRVEVFTLQADGRDEGFLELDFREAGACEIAFFGLSATLIGHGAGRWLMNRALERAWAAPINRLWVHTCTLDHPAALAFYRRSGFFPFRREVEVADDPRALGLLPPPAAPHAPLP